ncbi:MAG: YHS domain protein [Natronospirillum sp.]
MSTTLSLAKLPFAISTLFLLLGLPAISAAVEPIYTGFRSQYAIQGYDTVAYFTQNQAVRGDTEFQSEWQDTVWLFSSAEHKALFDANPEAYAPQYGGYRAYGMADGKAVRIDPMAFSVLDGKLYLNFSRRIHNRWELDSAAYIERADPHWSTLIADQ